MSFNLFYADEMSEIYHVLNRGVDKRKVFLDDSDYFRFIHDLFEFNDEANAINNYRKYKLNDIASRSIKAPRKLLVNIHAFCLMPNHYHLLLSSNYDRGISKFMKKVGIGYAKYFNAKYERVGALFQGRFKSKLLDSEAYFIHLPYYIHLNPLDLKFPEWRQRNLSNYKEALKFLKSYRWSSHMDYLGIKNFPSVTQRDFLNDFFNGSDGYKLSIEDWLKNLELDFVNDSSLEK